MPITIPRLNLYPGPAGGSEVFDRTALDDAAANTPGALGYCRVDATWAPTAAGKQTLINRLAPEQRFIAPSSTNNPTYDANDANGLPSLNFVAASTQYLAPNLSAAMAVGTTAGFIWFVVQHNGANYLTGNSAELDAADKVLNINLAVSGGTDYVRLLNGDASNRLQESALTDLNQNTWHLIMWTWDATAVLLFIDDAAKTLNATDTAVMTNGEFEIGRRGATYGNFKLAAMGWGETNIGLAAHDTPRELIFASAQSPYGLP